MEICKDITIRNYYKTLCRIKNIKNNDKIIIDGIEKEIDEINIDFKKVQSPDAVFKCYAFETGYYSSFGSNYDHH